MITGHVDGNLLVPEGLVCLLAGAQVDGHAIVEPGAGLITDGAAIGGNLKCRRCLFLDVVADSSVGGNLAAKGLLDGLFVHDSGIGGNPWVRRSLEGNLGFEFLRSRIGGNFAFEKNTGHTQIADNRVGGNLEFSDNIVGPFAIESNTIGGKLDCRKNDPLPAGGGNTAAPKRGQCRLL